MTGTACTTGRAAGRGEKVLKTFKKYLDNKDIS
jgi:hypothetical protein